MTLYGDIWCQPRQMYAVKPGVHASEVADVKYDYAGNCQAEKTSAAQAQNRCRVLLRIGPSLAQSDPVHPLGQSDKSSPSCWFCVQWVLSCLCRASA